MTSGGRSVGAPWTVAASCMGQTIRLVMTASSVMSSQWKPAAAIRASSPSKFARDAALDAEQHRAEVARRLLQVLEAGDVVLGAEHGEELAQRARALRQAQDVVFLPALPAQRPLLDVRQPLEVEVAAGDDGDDGAAVERAEVARARRWPAPRPARAPCPSTFSISTIVAQMRFSGASSTLAGGEPPEHREVQVADPRDRGAVDEAVDLGQGDEPAGLERPPQARRRRAARRGGSPSAGASAVGHLHEARRESPPPPTGATTRSGVGQRLEDLERRRSPGPR